MMKPLVKYIVEINTNGKGRDIEVWANSGAEAERLVIEREQVPAYSVSVRGVAQC